MSRVIIDNRFRQFGAKVQAEVVAAVDVAAEATAEAAKGVPSRYNLGPIVEQIKVYPARPSTSRPGRISAVVVSPDFRSWWFERGTYLDTQEPRIMPQRFMRKGLTYGRKVLEAELRSRLR